MNARITMPLLVVLFASSCRGGGAGVEAMEEVATVVSQHNGPCEGLVTRLNSFQESHKDALASLPRMDRSPLSSGRKGMSLFPVIRREGKDFQEKYESRLAPAVAKMATVSAECQLTESPNLGGHVKNVVLIREWLERCRAAPATCHAPE